MEEEEWVPLSRADPIEGTCPAGCRVLGRARPLVSAIIF